MIHHIEEAFEGRAIVQVLARVDLEAEIHAAGIEGIEDRRQRRPSSAKASSTSPGGRCGQG